MLSFLCKSVAESAYNLLAFPNDIFSFFFNLPMFWDRFQLNHNHTGNEVDNVAGFLIDYCGYPLHWPGFDGLIEY